MTQKYFDTEGHITDRGFQMLIHEELDETPRYELAEHLDFCDRCVERYTDFLVDDSLMVPREEIAPTVMEKLKHRARMVILSRTARVSIAACLALVIWVGGASRLQFVQPDKGNFGQTNQKAFSLQQAFQGANEGLDQIFSSFNAFLRGDHLNGKK